MMQVMHLCRIIKEVIATMDRRCFREFKRKKDPVRENMALENLRWDRDRQDIGEEMLKRMSVLGCERDGCGETVVLLVDADVERLGMEQSVGVIEEDFAQKKAEDKVSNYFEQ
jgi:hypothetical protein